MNGIFRLPMAAAAALMICSTVQADVTVEQKTTLNVASLINAHGEVTSNFSADRKREDTATHCEGMMSIFCKNLQNGDIVRLDRSVTWTLDPKKKTYRETAFATPEELAQMRAKMQARMEKLRSCPASPQKEQTQDKSKCEMSPPKFEVRKTDDKQSIAGHDTQRNVATVTASCTNKDTGEVCDTVVAVDLWMTQDKIAGLDDRRAFELAYAKKLGLDDPQGAMRTEIARFLGPYQAQIKQLTDKTRDLKGLPLKTSMRVVMGGPQCKTKADASGGDASGGDNANPLASVTQGGKALGKLMGGMFKKKKDDSTDAASATPAPAAPATPDPYAAYAQLGAFGIETVSISTEPVPATRYEIPPDWKKEEPKAAKESDDDVTCPKNGS